MFPLIIITQFSGSWLFYLQVQELRDVLNEEWVWFQQVLIDSDIMLQKDKEKFKNSLILSVEEFKKKVEFTVQEFNAKGPSLSLCLVCSVTHSS